MAKVQKTNAMRELDVAKIKYSSLTYIVDENNLGTEYVATKIGKSIDSVFKTLALINERKELIIACIPGASELDLKKLARLANCKRIEMLELKELFNYTGYIRGGCSPIGIKKRHVSFIHNSVCDLNEVVISAGQRGLQLQIAPQMLIEHLKMTVGDIII